ncbi:hypothetical protein HK107_02280 [Parvularcula sp. ZS-1/3]|uniref:Uncharacterized protein n=1 Tax=Parvularcula mediterranea TaxID=2732508 RepID=A0A7Y3RJH2_9PROT|nr:hypothetical protein [Parvularcula mediterranea]NNU15151.1 hypothetical protein [Parvularcula mediterranea]
MTLDRKTWARNMEALDRDIEKQRERERKARERSARNAQRKIDRLRKELSDAGELNDFEEQFAESVGERIDKYGSAFANPSLGRPGDALSSAQKRVVSAMKKKAKDAKKAAKAAQAEEPEPEAEAPPRAPFKPRIVE